MLKPLKQWEVVADDIYIYIWYFCTVNIQAPVFESKQYSSTKDYLTISEVVIDRGTVDLWFPQHSILFQSLLLHEA